MNILPGEPVPPGFEDEVNRTAKIQKAIDQFNAKSLIGIEYTLELHEDDRHEPGYLCTLCDKRGDPRTIIHHWTSFNHRMKYLEKHYPTAVREFNAIRYKPNSHIIVNQIVHALSKAIEDQHGRLSVTVYNADDFRRMKTRILQEVNNKFHFDERNGPDFLDSIDRSLWERVTPGTVAQATIQAPPKLSTLQITLKNKREHVGDVLDEISSESDGEGHAKKVKIRHQEKLNTTEKKLPTPKELSLQASHIAQERYKWEKYRCMLEIQLKQMRKIQQEYEKDPEKHPLYAEEWKKFWNQRYNELQAQGKDPKQHDYKKEWLAFWTKRIKQLFDQEVEKKEKEIKLQLGLPELAEEKVNQLKERYRVQVAPRKVVKVDETDVIDISDDDSSSLRIQPRRNSRSTSRSRRSFSRSLSPSPERALPARPARSKTPHATSSYRGGKGSDTYYEQQRHRFHHPSERSEYSRSHFSTAGGSSHGYAGGSYRVLDSHQMPKYMHSPTSHGSSGGQANENNHREELSEKDEGPLTVVSVLRLVIALEEHLGSLGHKVIDMLGKALALEKVKANSSDDLLLNEDHCVFFETIKEKLKGLLIADVIEDAQKIRAVKKAIRNIATVIHQVTQAQATSGNNHDKENKSATAGSGNAHNTTTNGGNELPFDRQLIASKLAAGLVVNGREDITSEQMDRLIQMFLLLVKLNKNRLENDGKPVRMRDVAAELGLPCTIETEDFEANDVAGDLRSNEDETHSKQNVEQVNKTQPDASTSSSGSSMLESLTDSDLQTLLQNFKHLSHEEQHHLIVHLKKLESVDPQRVEKLRKYVNMDDEGNDTTVNNDEKDTNSKDRSSTRNQEDSPPGTSRGRRSGYSDDEDNNASIGTRRQVTHHNVNLTNDDDDDDDYNFEDVFKAASTNVSRCSEDSVNKSNTPKESAEPTSTSPNALTFNAAGFNVNLSDTQNLIANLMGSIQKSNAASSNVAKTANTAGTTRDLQVKPTIQQQAPNNAMQIQQAAAQTMMPQQQQQQQQSAQSANYYQQTQAMGYGGGYDQQNMAPYFNQAQMATGYGNATAAPNNYAAAQNYGPAWAPQQPWQNFAMPMPTHPQQQNQQAAQGYQMYGRSGN